MKPGTWSFYADAVRGAVERVVGHLDEMPDFEDLARDASVSPFHFHRIFREMVGETPLQLHRRLRLERAAWTLLHEDVPVTEVAFRAGYGTHEAFTRAFKARYGRAPSEFRDAHGEAASGAGGVETLVQLPARSGIHYHPGPCGRRSSDPRQGDDGLDVRIVELPELHLAAVRHIGPYQGLSGAFQRLLALVGTSGLFRPDTMVLTIYHNDPETTPATELRSDAAITVPAGSDLPAGLKAGRLESGRYARATHIGSYRGLGDVWARLMGQWLPASGERVANAPPFEIYRNDPARTPEEKLHTEVYVRLES